MTVKTSVNLSLSAETVPMQSACRDKNRMRRATSSALVVDQPQGQLLCSGDPKQSGGFPNSSWLTSAAFRFSGCSFSQDLHCGCDGPSLPLGTPPHAPREESSLGLLSLILRSIALVQGCQTARALHRFRCILVLSCCSSSRASQETHPIHPTSGMASTPRQNAGLAANVPSG
jgi:hypothetical protein